MYKFHVYVRFLKVNNPTYIHKERDRKREREKKTERKRERKKEREKERENEKKTDRDRHTERQGKKERTQMEVINFSVLLCFRKLIK